MLVDELRHLRNQIVHGIESPSGVYLSTAIELLENLLLNLKEQSSEEVRKVIESSDEIKAIIDRVTETTDKIKLTKRRKRT